MWILSINFPYENYTRVSYFPSELQFDNTNFVHLTTPPKHEYIIIIITITITIIINFAGLSSDDLSL